MCLFLKPGAHFSADYAYLHTSEVKRQLLAGMSVNLEFEGALRALGAQVWSALGEGRNEEEKLG